MPSAGLPLCAADSRPEGKATLCIAGHDRAARARFLAAGAINLRVISDHWFELLRLALSIKTGTVTASVILRELAAYPRQNGLAFPRANGKLERTSYAAMAGGPRAASS